MKRKSVQLPVIEGHITTRAVNDEVWENIKKLAKFDGVPVGQYICMLIHRDVRNKEFLLKGDE